MLTEHAHALGNVPMAKNLPDRMCTHQIDHLLQEHRVRRTQITEAVGEGHEEAIGRDEVFVDADTAVLQVLRLRELDVSDASPIAKQCRTGAGVEVTARAGDTVCS